MDAAESNQEPRWRRLPEERPRQIIEAALEVFGEHGLGQARLEDIARRAGLSKGTIYLYFPNKEELFREVVRSTLVARIEEAEQELSRRSGETATEQLSDYMTGWWKYLSSPGYSTLYRLVIGELHRFPDLARFYADEVVSRAHTLVASVVARGVERGEFRQVDPLVAGRMMSSMLISHALWCSKREIFKHVTAASEEQILSQLKDFVFHSLRPIPSAAPTPAASTHEPQ
ncbi:MAG: TetR/AcrR family transcriptional regulator [Gemmatimonadaceae bacterium]